MTAPTETTITLTQKEREEIESIVRSIDNTAKIISTAIIEENPESAVEAGRVIERVVVNTLRLREIDNELEERLRELKIIPEQG